MPNKSHWSQRNTYIQESSWTLGFTWKGGSTPAAQRKPLDQWGLSFTGGLAKLKADGIHWAAKCSVSAPTLQNQKWTQLLCWEGRTQGCFHHSRWYTLWTTLSTMNLEIFLPTPELLQIAKLSGRPGNLGRLKTSILRVKTMETKSCWSNYLNK